MSPTTEKQIPTCLILWEHFYLSIPRCGYHWLPGKCLDSLAFLDTQHEVLPEGSQLQRLSDTPPQLVDATILFVNFSTKKKKDAFIRICIVDERIGIGINKVKDQDWKRNWYNHSVLAGQNLNFVRGENAMFSSRHQELLMEASLTQCLFILMKQLDFVESEFEPVKYQKDLF
jgi:hypothetical protein